MDAIEKLKPGATREEIDAALAGLPAALASYADAAEAKIRAMGIEPPARCASCAFTAGTFPNTKAPATGLDALKCLIEDHPFGCHHDKGPDGLPTRLCAGFRMIQAAETGPALTNAPWSYSDERPALPAAE
jgi:hypothetical protein